MAFYGKARFDVRLLPTHQSLYLALFFLWRQSGSADLFTISRRELMPLARLQSVATYHKCIRELKAFGYIEYQPTYNYYKGSQVSLLLGEERCVDVE
ncbi:hypothetical protein HH214_21380 [Mucilaginibacter robiniae]|uniref:Transcriptional regulator n=1 Tax=Mucilaginibacter robiniae TaxID=2728022 RepID=A0A7L5E779_9SPHI|nr:hypothetical protein [Mucilaginibacter robiniae]QJD98247.1 hypothetical protein HH214_21380 [Mucilaginibacter robiniae]